MAFTDKENQIIKWSVENGKTGQETRAAIMRYRVTGSPIDPNKPIPQVSEPSFFEEVRSEAEMRADRVGQILKRSETPILRKGVQVLGQGAGLAASTIERGVEQIPGVKQTFQGLGKGIQWLATSEFSPIKQIGDKIAENEALQEAVTLYDTDQDFKDTVDAVANIARLGGDVLLVKQAIDFTKNVTNKISVFSKPPPPPSTPPSPPLKTLTQGIGALGVVRSKVDDIIKTTKKLKTKIQESLASKNVNPQLQSSTERLFLEGTKRLDDPLTTYEKYLTQSKQAIKDIKVDPAISVVGEKIGNEFNKVVQIRRNVGKAMAQELAKIGNTKTDLLGAVDDFVKELADNGVVYDRVTKTINLISKQTKFTNSDIKLIRVYAKQFQELGTKPTIAELDAFLSRITSEIDLYKATNNIIGTTNAERIIKGSLSKLREQFDPKITGNSALKVYSDARASYSELSDFIQEGSGFLGKITQSGDFAKDASLTKSAVQSVLNNGKKDWLIRLETLTGYPALDDAVLALQAMKDAGDFRGTSLLQLLSEGQVPISSMGIADKVINYGIEKGKRAIIGTPEQQTRLFLQKLKNESTP